MPCYPTPCSEPEGTFPCNIPPENYENQTYACPACKPDDTGKCTLGEHETMDGGHPTTYSDRCCGAAVTKCAAVAVRVTGRESKQECERFSRVSGPCEHGSDTYPCNDVNRATVEPFDQFSLPCAKWCDKGPPVCRKGVAVCPDDEAHEADESKKRTAWLIGGVAAALALFALVRVLLRRR